MSISSLAQNLLEAAAADELTPLVLPLQHHESAPDFAELEAAIRDRYPTGPQLQYPEAIRDLYTYAFPKIDCGVIRLHPCRAEDPLGELRAAALDGWSPGEIVGRGLLPIAEDGNDGGPLCVDLREADPDSAPVCLWDHDWHRISDPLFENSAAMLRCVTSLLSGASVEELARHGGAGAAAYYGWWDEV